MSNHVTLAQLIESRTLSLQTGPFGSQLHSYDYRDQGVPVIPTEGIQDGRIDHSVLPKINSKKLTNLDDIGCAWMISCSRAAARRQPGARL